MPKPGKAKELEKLRKDLEPCVRSSFLIKSIQRLAEHAAKGGKPESLDRDSLLRLFEVVGSLSKEASSSSEPELTAKLARFREAKTALRVQVLEGISPPTLTIPLKEAEIFSEDLFPKEVYLKVDSEAIKSDEKNVFPAFLPERGTKRFISLPSGAQVRKKTKPLAVDGSTTHWSRNQQFFPKEKSIPQFSGAEYAPKNQNTFRNRDNFQGGQTRAASVKKSGGFRAYNQVAGTSKGGPYGPFNKGGTQGALGKEGFSRGTVPEALFSTQNFGDRTPKSRPEKSHKPKRVRTKGGPKRPQQQ